jgi:hypothetical protein
MVGCKVQYPSLILFVFTQKTQGQNWLAVLLNGVAKKCWYTLLTPHNNNLVIIILLAPVLSVSGSRRSYALTWLTNTVTSSHKKAKCICYSAAYNTDTGRDEIDFVAAFLR